MSHDVVLPDLYPTAAVLRIATGVLLACSLAILPAGAQPVEIISTDPAEDATSVPLEKRIEFHLNKPTPQFGSHFAEKFFWSSAAELSTSIQPNFGHDYGSDGKLTEIFFEMQHTPDTDFSFVAYGVQAADGSRMDRPFVLNYSTASARGQRSVSGLATFAEEPSASASSRREHLKGLIRRSIERNKRRAQARRAALQEATPESPAGGPPSVSASQTRTQVAALQHQESTTRTVVLLLDNYTLNDDFWEVRSAAVPDESGNYTFDQVRDGTYWPIAITYASERGEAVSAYGFYDADGDRAPDPIQVSGGDVDDVALTIYPFEASSAQARRTIARDRADAEASDQRLLQIQALVGAQGSAAFPGGTAYTWRYTFYSPSQDQLTYVDVSPIAVQSGTGAAPDETGQQQKVPDEPVDSDRAVEIADQHGGNEFRDQYDKDVRLYLTAGDLDLAYRPPRPSIFWKVDYVSPLDTSCAEKTIFVDLASGEILDPVNVASEEPPEPNPSVSMAQNHPNPFSSSTTFSFRLPEARHVKFEVFNTLGQRVALIVDAIRPAGTHDVTWEAPDLPSGVYFYRLEAGDAAQTKRMTLVR